MRIGFDLDGVIFDFVGNLREYLITQGFKREDLPPAGTWDFFKYEWGLTTQEFLEYAAKGVNEGYIFAQGNAYEDSINAMWKLRDKGHTIHIITNRTFGTKSTANTEKWLVDNDVPYDSLTIGPDKTIIATDLFIEDNVDNYLALREAGIGGYLLNRPWNQEFKADYRVDSCDEFVEVIDLWSAVSV